MYTKYNQRDITVHMDTRSSTVTTSIHAQLGDKVASKHPSRHTQWESVHQMKVGSKWNDMSGKS